MKDILACARVRVLVSVNVTEVQMYVSDLDQKVNEDILGRFKVGCTIYFFLYKAL